MIKAILILAFFQVTPEINQRALDYTVEGHADSALLLLEREIENSTVKDSAYYQARYLQAWNLKQFDTREDILKSKAILESDLEEIPSKYGELRWRMYSLLGNNFSRLNDWESYGAMHIKSFDIANSINDSVGVTLAIRNLYSYSSRILNDKEATQSYIFKLRELRKESTNTRVILESLITEAYFENKYGDNSKAISLTLEALRLGESGGAQWYQDVQLARMRFLLEERHFEAAKSVMYEMLNNRLIQESNSLTYIALARLVKLHVYTGDMEQAEIAYFELNKLSKDVDVDALEEGIEAKLAYEGFEDIFDYDPLFRGLKKSGIGTSMIWFLIAGAGGLLLALVAGMGWRRQTVPSLPAQNPADRDAWLQYD